MKIILYKVLIYFVKGSFSFAFIAITFSSLLFIYKNKAEIKKKFYPSHKLDVNFGGSDLDKKWAKKIMQGGYILHFRHAERDKWIDVQMYDALESDVHNKGKNETRFAERDYFAEAVCLNERGLIQARAIGEHLKNINFPFGHVVSSPSCRSRQTADIAFGGYDELSRDLVHYGPYTESRDTRKKKLFNYYLNLPLEKNKNTIVSAHNGVIFADLLSNNDDYNLNLEEGGFYVLSKDKGKLYLEHEFHNFNSFIRQFYKR